MVIIFLTNSYCGVPIHPHGSTVLAEIINEGDTEITRDRFVNDANLANEYFISLEREWFISKSHTSHPNYAEIKEWLTPCGTCEARA